MPQWKICRNFKTFLKHIDFFYALNRVFFSNQVQINLKKVVVFFVSMHQPKKEKHLPCKITLNLFFKIYIFSWIVFFYIFSAKRLQKSARNYHKCQFFMEKIYPWNSPMCFQVLLYCFQLGTEYIWHRNIWFLLSLLCFKMRRNPFWNRILTIMPMCFHKNFFTNTSTKLNS